MIGRRYPATELAPFAIAAAAVLSYILTHKSPAWAVLVLLAPCVAFWVMRTFGRGFLLAVAILLLIPYWYPHVWLVAPLVGALGLVAGIAKTRLRVIDLAFCGLMLSLTLSWVAHPELGVSFKWFAEGMVPFAYYVWARLTLTERLFSQLQWVMLISSGLAACTLLYEAVHGTTVFADPHIYQWAGSAASVFRAGGVFGGSPTAAIILATMLLASVSLYKTHRLVVLSISVVVIAGIIVTLDRAGLIGLLFGSSTDGGPFAI